jgi:hypothetical protein
MKNFKKEMEKVPQVISDFSKQNLDLGNPGLSGEYYYSCLPLCAIDAVFSIGVTYSSTINTVKKFCDYFKIVRFYKESRYLHEYPPIENQLSINNIIHLFETTTSERMVADVFRNRQRTSSRNGILKSDAVLAFSKVLQTHKINYFQDCISHINDVDLRNEICNIPGQKSGISMQYLFMLAGNDKLIKPDRMVLGYLERIMGFKPTIAEAQELLESTHQLLINEYPSLTLRGLDHLIWSFQRMQ